jgi:hypothetical protein
MVLTESFKNLFQDLEMLFMCVGVHQKVVNLDDLILQVLKYSLHETLKRGWTSEEPHR